MSPRRAQLAWEQRWSRPVAVAALLAVVAFVVSGAVASSPVVRKKLVEWQRKIAAGRNIVCEGRDQVTIAFPQAECKFFLSADPAERARRRYDELTARGTAVTLDEILQAQSERDARDAARDIAPMAPAADAIQLDSTRLTLNQVVDRMEQEVRGKLEIEANETRWRFTPESPWTEGDYQLLIDADLAHLTKVTPSIGGRSDAACVSVAERLRLRDVPVDAVG